LSLEIFRRVRQYTPLLVPTSIDEGFMDFTDSPTVFRCRSAADLVARIRRELDAEVGVPFSAGLGSSRWLAKLATEHCKPAGFLEVTEEQERDFLRDIPIEKLAGIAKRRARSLRALGVWTLGDVGRLPLSLVEKRYGCFGLHLWLLSTGQFRERLKLENKPRTCIGSSTTLPYDEPDHEAAGLFLLDQAERLLTTLIRENLKVREIGVYVRFNNFDGNGACLCFPSAQCQPAVINPAVENLYWQSVTGHVAAIRQVCVNFWNLQPLDLQPELFGANPDYQRRQLQAAIEQIESRYGRRSVKTGRRLLFEQQAGHLVSDKSKCPFIPQREMEVKMSRIPQPSLDPTYEEEWQPLEREIADLPLGLPRAWGRSTGRTQKFS
jgi:DNA polymerase-4